MTKLLRLNHRAPAQVWRLKGLPIQEVPSTTVLGRITTRSLHGDNEQVEATKTKAQRATRMLGWLNLFSPRASLSLFKHAFNALVTSVIVSGTTHSQLFEAQMASLRTVASNTMRRWLRTSLLCSHQCLFIETDWDPIDSWIWFSKLKLLEEIKVLPEREDAHHVVRARIADTETGDKKGLVAECKRFYRLTDTPDQWGILSTRSKEQRRVFCRGQAFHGVWLGLQRWVRHNPDSSGDYAILMEEVLQYEGPAWHLSNGTKRERGLMTGARCGGWTCQGGKANSGGYLEARLCRLCLRKVDSVHHILLECPWEPYKPLRRCMAAGVQATLSPEQLRWWREARPDQMRLALLGKSIGDSDPMDARRARDSVVKVFMREADDVRREAGLGPLCGAGPYPPAFSLEEALIWSVQAERERSGDSEMWARHIMQ